MVAIVAYLTDGVRQKGARSLLLFSLEFDEF
jgi:hypothetical protein